MKRGQILYLLVGLLFLAGGFWALAQMTEMNQLADEKSQIAVLQTESNVEGNDGIVEETSALTRGLEWLTSQGIPVWVYVFLFVVLVLAVRIMDVRMQIKRYERRIADKEGN